jgi:hypothetical protein
MDWIVIKNLMMISMRKMYTPFYCIDCGQEFDSRKELEEHEIKHQSLSKPKE